MLWTKGYNDSLYAYEEAGLVDSLNDETCRLLKAVDGQTGKIAAVSEWSFLLDPRKNAEKQPISLDEPPPANWPDGGNWAIRRFFKRNTELLYKEFFAGLPFVGM